MFASLKKLAVAVALTFAVATGVIVASGIAAPQPAEAGIISSIKGAAKSVGRGVAGVAKDVAGGARAVGRTVEKRVLLPAGRGLAKAGSTVIKVVKKLPGPAKCIIKCPL